MLIAFIPIRMMGLTANIMSLGGIAIAIGALVDAVDRRGRERTRSSSSGSAAGRKGDYHRRGASSAIKEVGAPSFFSLLVIAVAFLPVLTLEAQEGRLFKPLAYTKNLRMVVAAVLAITLDPALRLLFTRMRPVHLPAALARAGGERASPSARIHPEETHPISRGLFRLYEPVCAVVAARTRAIVIGAAACARGRDHPDLPAGSAPSSCRRSTRARCSTCRRRCRASRSPRRSSCCRRQDRIIKQFPEVERVFGKAGRAETPTDPAPLSMIETVITLKPREQWRKVDTWYSAWAPEWASRVFRRITPDRISQDELVERDERGAAAPGRLQRLDDADQGADSTC